MKAEEFSTKTSHPYGDKLSTFMTFVKGNELSAEFQLDCDDFVQLVPRA